MATAIVAGVDTAIVTIRNIFPLDHDDMAVLLQCCYTTVLLAILIEGLIIAASTTVCTVE